MGFLRIILSVYCIAVFWGCHRTQPIRNVHAESLKIKDSEVGFCSPPIDIDASLCNKYQTFDEFSMKGVGTVLKEPYVYVKGGKDTVVVVSSDKSDSCRVYLRCGVDMWYSHMSYELWKSKGYVLQKEPWERAAREYDRYFYNDTIFECCKSFGELYSHYKYYIKTKDVMIEFRASDNSRIFTKPTAQVRRLLNNSFSALKPYDTLYISGVKVYCRKYIRYEDSRKIYYKQNPTKVEYEFPKKSYGMWGIQPGVDERRLVNGQDINNFSHEHPNGIYIPEIEVYENVDEMPVFPGGDEALRNYIRKKVANFSLNDKSTKVVIAFTVTERGAVEDIEILKTTTNNEKINNYAIEIVRDMPRWSPGLLNGKYVKVRYLIPIEFSTS